MLYMLNTEVQHILLQVGTAVVTRQDKRLAVGRLGALVEQIEALVSKDLQVILVRSLRQHLFSGI